MEVVKHYGEIKTKQKTNKHPPPKKKQKEKRKRKQCILKVLYADRCIVVKKVK
jgi:hypothetical protein